MYVVFESKKICWNYMLEVLLRDVSQYFFLYIIFKLWYLLDKDNVENMSD